ncbi:MAG: Sensory box histidine kinase/response regulator [Labilithrix sp.]|nr:Sensory box histidine kinase/response regulator [Labilithrix sp.]
MSGHAKPPEGDAVSNTDDFFEMSLDNLCVAGLDDGYLKRVNASWTRTLGWTAEELLSRPSVEFVHPEDRALTLGGRRTLQMGSDMGPLVNRYLHKDGSFRWFEWRSVAHVDRGLVYAAARDITEQKLAEERLLQAAEREKQLQRQLTFADRMASVGTLAGGVAHEINNPLACVAANISMIIDELDRMPPSPELREMALDVQTAAERIRKIVCGLHTFSRVEEDRRGVIDLRKVLDLATDMTASNIRDRANLVRNYGDTPLVDADVARLGQVFINLLVNAAQALPAGRREANEIRITTTTDADGRAVVEIHDSGTGIPAHLMSRIFDPFFTTKPVGVGTGLGLSICHTIVTSMGGEISATSAAGCGTTFRVVLPPAASALRQGHAARGGGVHAPPARAAILVVDDEPSVGRALARVLRDHDVTVVSAARTALELLDAGKEFAVIFSDLMMPEVSGMDLFDELQQRFPEAARRVVFVSGGAFTPQANAFLERVINARLDKPFDPREVRALVERHLTAP